VIHINPAYGVGSPPGPIIHNGKVIVLPGRTEAERLAAAVTLMRERCGGNLGGPLAAWPADLVDPGNYARTRTVTTIFTCRFRGCGKELTSYLGMRAHCRAKHLRWWNQHAEWERKVSERRDCSKEELERVSGSRKGGRGYRGGTPKKKERPKSRAIEIDPSSAAANPRRRYPSKRDKREARAATAAASTAPAAASSSATPAAASSSAAPAAASNSAAPAAASASSSSSAAPAAASASSCSSAAPAAASASSSAAPAATSASSSRSAASSAAASAKPAATSTEPGPRGEIVGRTIKVRWAAAPAVRGGWYRGVIRQFNSATGQHFIGYDDGDEKWHALAEEDWQLVGGVTSPGLPKQEQQQRGNDGGGRASKQARVDVDLTRSSEQQQQGRGSKRPMRELDADAELARKLQRQERGTPQAAKMTPQQLKDRKRLVMEQLDQLFPLHTDEEVPETVLQLRLSETQSCRDWASRPLVLVMVLQALDDDNVLMWRDNAIHKI